MKRLDTEGSEFVGKLSFSGYYIADVWRSTGLRKTVFVYPGTNFIYDGPVVYGQWRRLEDGGFEPVFRGLTAEWGPLIRW